MHTSNTKKIIVAIIALIVVVGGYMLIHKTPNTTTTLGTSTTTDSSASSTNVSLDQIGTVQQGNGYTITQVPIDDGKVPQPIPNLTEPVVFGNDPSLTPDIKKALSDKITGLQAELLKNPASPVNWINLGVYQKMAGDYVDASISWKYASRLAPKDYVSLGNLGDLYAYYLHDTTQAVSYYNKAIELSPTTAYLYIQLANVYKDVLKDVSTARNVIDRGLTAIPHDPSLTEFKANLQ